VAVHNFKRGHIINYLAHFTNLHHRPGYWLNFRLMLNIAVLQVFTFCSGH